MDKKPSLPLSEGVGVPTPSRVADSPEKGAQTEAFSHRSQRHDSLLASLMVLTQHHQKLFSAESLTAGLPLRNNRLTPFLFVRAARRAGLHARVVDRTLDKISPHVLPAVAMLKDESAVVLQEKGKDGSLTVYYPDKDETRVFKRERDFEQVYNGTLILVRQAALADMGEDVFTSGQNWFKDTLYQFKGLYIQVALAAVVINLLAIVSPLFVMNVYDRVVPNNAYETLVMLTLGIFTAYVFDFILKVLRGYFIDIAGRGADILMSGRLYQQVLNIRLGQQGSSSGAFANQLREFESLREFFTSATLVTLIDLPFVFLFIGIIALIGGWVAIVPLIALPIVLFISFTIQSPLRAIIQEAMHDLDAKHGHLVESINGLETIKSLNIQSPMQARWEQAVGAVARIGQRTRFLASLGMNFSGFMQQLVTVGVVFVGVFLIADGQITVGALVASTLLAGRTMAPLGQAVALYTRFNQAMSSLKTLNNIMAMDVERPDGKSFVYMPKVTGDIEFQDISFSYPKAPMESLKNISFTIKPGEKVAIIGRTGSGKSTILRLLLNLYQPTNGSILLEGLEIRQIDPVQVRRNMGYVPQNILLFRGTLRHNIQLADPDATPDTLQAVAQLSGVNEFARRHPMGFDMPVGERGDTLSGGQRQAVAIARSLLKNPPILLMDEPTSEMDNKTEERVLQNLKEVTRDKTLVVVTHKFSILDLVDRIIVMDYGRIIADGPKDKILKSFATNAKKGA